jgi:aminopeptidase N
MFLLFVLFAQWREENLEAKFYHPRFDQQMFRAESTHEFNVLYYDLAVTLPMTERSIEGVNRISCRSLVNGLSTAALHAYTLTIDSVAVDGVTASHAASGESLIINLPQTYNANDSFDIVIGYHGSWNVSYYQTGFCYYPENYTGSTEHSIAYTLGEPWDARRWMPCYDEPYDKADNGCRIAVTLPDSFVVCANGVLNGVVNNSDNTATYTWEEHYPITTYLMHFGASRFAVWSQWYQPETGDSIEIRHYVWPEDSAVSVSGFSDIPAAMFLFDSLYGSYPFDRYGQDVVSPYSWGGMEHQEMTTMHRDCVYGSQGWRRVMAHELSHMWWGDMVTCIDFRDIWLNEGCATYSDANYLWYIYGYSTFQSTLASRAQSYYDEDVYNRRPLYDPPLNEIFNVPYTYYKACWVMHMLRYLDEAQFFDGMAAYRDSLAYGNASTEDLKGIFSDVYGTDLTWFFDEWVYGQGYPEYEIFWYCDPSGSEYDVTVHIYQVQTNAPPVFHMPLEIEFHTTGSDTTVRIPISASPQHAQFTVSDSVTSLNIDPDARLLKACDVYYGIEEYAEDNPVFNELRVMRNPSCVPEIMYVINQAGRIRLALYDVSGRTAHTIHDGYVEPGEYSHRIQGLAAGIYFCRLVTPVNEQVKKLVVVE